MCETLRSAAESSPSASFVKIKAWGKSMFGLAGGVSEQCRVQLLFGGGSSTSAAFCSDSGLPYSKFPEAHLPGNPANISSRLMGLMSPLPGIVLALGWDAQAPKGPGPEDPGSPLGQL